MNARSKSFNRETSSKKHRTSSGSESDEWVEKSNAHKQREDWMGLTGMLKTYTKNDIKPKQEDKNKRNIDSYNPSTSARELNPYWKDGGSGLPQTPESFRKTKTFVKPSNDCDFYGKSSKREFKRPQREEDYSTSAYRYNTYERKDDQYKNKSYSSQTSRYGRSSWRRGSQGDDKNFSRNDKITQYDTEERHSQRNKNSNNDEQDITYENESASSDTTESITDCDEKMNKIAAKIVKAEIMGNTKLVNELKAKLESYKMRPQSNQTVEKSLKDNTKYLSDEKINKLASKIVKAEIMGDTSLVNELKAKLEAAREYRKVNPNAKAEDEEEGILLTSMNSIGNSRPLTKSSQGDPRSKGGKRKVTTHDAGQRQKYFCNDDKYNLAQMFQEEKYGTNYDNDAQLANIASKHKNPNDDLEDIFTDEITKRTDDAKDEKREKDRAIKEHVKMEKSLEGCEYCLDSKNMLKHLIVSCASRVYLALPARKSLVKGHCLISTIHHSTCATSVDEDVWEEIMDYRKALVKYFNEQSMDVVFYETATRLHTYPHMVINCVPMPRDVGDVAAIYFKKALLECEAEWSMNKKVVELKGKSLRKGVPKGLPYFWIDFAMDPGFAHIIEDQQLFPRTFAEEIIGGILDLEHTAWTNPRREHTEDQRKKVLEFLQHWKQFDTVVKR